MAGWQLGLQMWGSSEPGDSVTPKWPVCFLRRNGDVRRVSGFGESGVAAVGGGGYFLLHTPPPSSAPRPPSWLWVTWNQLKVGFSEWTRVPNL